MMEKLTFHSQAKNVFLAALNFCGFSVSCCERLLQKILFKPNLFRSSFIFIDLFYTLHSSIFTFTFQTKFTIYVKSDSEYEQLKIAKYSMKLFTEYRVRICRGSRKSFSISISNSLFASSLFFSS